MSSFQGEKITLKLSEFIVKSFKEIDQITHIVSNRLLPLIYKYALKETQPVKSMSFCKIIAWEEDSVVLDVFQVTDKAGIILATEEMTLAESLLGYFHWFDEKERESIILEITSELCEVIMEGI